MKKLRYVLLFILCLFLFKTNTYALSNYDTNFNINVYDWNTFLSNVNCGNDNLKEVIDNLIVTTDFESSNWKLMIYKGYTTNNVYLFLVPKNSSKNNMYYSGFRVSPTTRTQLVYSFGSPYARYLRIKTDSCNSNSIDLTTSNSYISFLNLLNNNTYVKISDSIGDFTNGDTSIDDLPWYSSELYNNNLGFTTFSNNESYTINDNWFYFASFPFIFNYQIEQGQTNYNNYYYKNIVIDTVTYTFGDELPSYYQLYNSSVIPSEPNFIGYQDSLKTTYTNLSVNDISNYSLKLKFKAPQSILGVYQRVEDYVDSTSFDYICSGRVNNTNYYSYESFNCSLSNSYTINDNIIEYTFNNLVINQSVNNYDKIYVTVKSNFNNNDFTSVVFDLSYTYSLGSFLNTDYKGNIYESYTNLPLNFKLYLSSNNSLLDSNVYVKDYSLLYYGINYRGFSNTSFNMNSIYGSSILGSLGGEKQDFSKLQVSNSIDSGAMIYQENSAIPVPSLDLIFNQGIIISFNNTSSNEFYYVDSTGNITNNIFNKPLISDDITSNYNISYYIGVVNNFIDDLSTESLEFSNLTQTIYNNFPLMLQTFIFVTFILFCIYFIYLLIKK